MSGYSTATIQPLGGAAVVGQRATAVGSHSSNQAPYTWCVPNQHNLVLHRIDGCGRKLPRALVVSVVGGRARRSRVKVIGHRALIVYPLNDALRAVAEAILLCKSLHILRRLPRRPLSTRRSAGAGTGALGRQRTEP
eukprot:2304103-Prymnesium_polylepis.1